MRGWLVVALAAAGTLQSVDVQAQRYARGLVREPEAVYRTFPRVPLFRAFLPPEVDNTHRFPQPGNQGQQSSCTAWAVGYAMRSSYEAHRIGWNVSSPANQFSPSFIYNQLNRNARGCGEGTAISSALQLIKDRGAATMADFPYNESNCSFIPSRDILDRAGQYKINGWRTVSAEKLDDIKGQLHIGHPVVFGMEISTSFEELRGDRVYDDVSSPRNGYHAMVLVGYSERRQAFKLINSWGTDWGDRGFGWISYRALARLSDRLFVMDMPAPPKADPFRLAPEPVPIPPVTIVTPPPIPVATLKEVELPPVVTPLPKDVPVPPVAVKELPPDPIPAPQVTVTEPPPKPKPPAVVMDTPPQPTPAPTVVVVEPPPKPAPIITPPFTTPVVATKLTLAQIRQELARRVDSIPCSRLESRVTDDGAIQISGMTGARDTLTGLETEFRGWPEVRNVEINVSSRPWPQCEALLTLENTLATPRGMQIEIRAGKTQRLSEGDPLVIEINTPSHPSYLYVSYIQASGDVVHLIKPEGRVPRPVAANTRIVLGADPRGPSYRISAPFGDEMIVVIAAASPLFGMAELPSQQTEREYLTAFRKAFIYQAPGYPGKRIVSGTSVTLRTHGR